MKPRHVAAPVLTVCLFLSGCSFSIGLSQQQKDAIQSFGNSTAMLGTSIPPEFVSMRDRTIRMRIDGLGLIYPLPDGWPTYANLDENFEPNVLQTRTDAAQVLASYGRLLSELATNSDSAALNEAVGNFQSSVAGLAKKELSSQQLDTIGQAVKAIAGFYIEHKRAEAVKTIVKDTRDQVGSLCDLLAADFNPKGGNLMTDLKDTASELVVSAGPTLKKLGKARPPNYGAWVRLYWEGKQNEEYANTIGVKIQTAIKSTKAANDAVSDSLEKSEFNFTSVSDLRNDIAEVRVWKEALGE